MPETTRTPTGAYPKPAPVHNLDLEAETERLLARLPGHRRQSESLVRESGVSVILIAMEAGDVLKDHAAGGVVTVPMLRGHAALASATGDADLSAGCLAVLQPDVRHSLTAQERSVVVLTVTGGDA